ncbi:MAG: terminase small subunit, partial [Paracoccaceae bacterium]
WKISAKKMGAPVKFKGPEELQDAVTEYFQWLEDNPLKESKLVSYQGESKLEMIPKMQAATLGGLQMHLGISHECWRKWRTERADLVEVVAWAEKAIRNQKFVGAAADLLNANIIARDLGLADRQEQSGPDGGPIQVEAMPPTEQARRLAFLLRRGVEETPTEKSE